MFKRATTAFCLAVLCFLVLSPLTADAQTAGDPSATWTLLVKLVVGLSVDQQRAVIARAGGVEISSIPVLRIHVVEVPTAALDSVLALYQADPQVQSVEVNKTRTSEAIPSDPLYANQWALPRIGWDQVFGTITPTGFATVALLDTGVDASHQELVGKVVPGISLRDGSNGMTDSSGHGTWLAGIIAARTDTMPLEGIAGLGYAGVHIMPVTVLDANGEGQDSDVIAGVIWAADHGADVILMAFSAPEFSANLQDAIDYAWSRGAVVVAAVGNNASSTPTFPAGDRGVMGVAAIDQNDSPAWFSNSGQAVFIGAPGVDIQTIDIDGNFIVISGTSAAAAHVAGLAAFMKAVDPALTNGIIVGRIARNADPAGTAEQTGNGRINMPRALADTSTEEVQPAGADPVGDGGPFVGPYRAAGNVASGSVSMFRSNCSQSLPGGMADSGAVVCAGWTAAITGNGNTNYRIQWYRSTTITAANLVFDTGYSAPNGATSQSGTETQTATNTSGSNQTWTVLICNGGAGACSAGNIKASATFTLRSASTAVATGLSVAGASGTYSGTVNLTATLTSGGSGVIGKSISFTLNGTSVGSATTNSSGLATLSNISLTGINSGTYNPSVNSGVTASFAGDSGFQASSGSATLTVTPKPVVITPSSGQSKVYGASDPTLTFSNDGGLATSAFTGALSRAAGEDVGTYAIGLGTLSAGGNYSLSLAGTPVTFAIMFKMSNLQDPYAPPPGRSFKVKSAIPLKWQFLDANNVPMDSPSANPQVKIYAAGSCGGENGDAIAVDDAGSSGLRYETATKTWQYNWKTTGMQAGCYNIYIDSVQSINRTVAFPIQLAR